MRDPRVDPKPLDVVKAPGGVERWVASSTKNGVVYNACIGRQWLNSSVRVTLDDWRENVKDWEVLHAAE